MNAKDINAHGFYNNLEKANMHYIQVTDVAADMAPDETRAINIDLDDAGMSDFFDSGSGVPNYQLISAAAGFGAGGKLEFGKLNVGVVSGTTLAVSVTNTVTDVPQIDVTITLLFLDIRQGGR